MSHSVISDNWSLQNISELFVDGMDDSDGHCIQLDRENDSYRYGSIPIAVVQTEALFDFITDIILRDQVIVEEEYTDVWRRQSSPLDDAVKSGVIKAYPFLIDHEKLVQPRNEFVDRICVTSGIRADHNENVTGWEKRRQAPHKMLSQTLWGGAGMLARGFVYEKGYTPHPIRKRLFVGAGVVMESADAVVQVNNILSEKRAKLSSVYLKQDELHSLTINMPPLPMMVIQNSRSIDDLISVALQVRDEYQELRDWLGCYQQALSDGSYKDLAKFQRILRSISQYVDSRMGVGDTNAATFTAGIGILKVGIKGRPLNALLNQFGVRAMLNRIIVSRSGAVELRKFLQFFGHQRTAVGLKVLEAFSM